MTTRPAAYALYKNDYLWTNGVEDVTFTPNDGTPASIADVKAKQEPMNISDIRMLGSDIGISSDEGLWRIWDTSLAGTVPQVKDRFTTSGGTVWRIENLILEAWDTQWLCFCKKELV